MPSAPKWLFDSVEFLSARSPVAVITDTVQLSPSVKKICCNGNLSNFRFTVGSYIDFRVSDTEVRRYTASSVDAESGNLEFIVHLHGKGCGSHFMNSLKAGDTIRLNTPRAYEYYDKTAEKFVIFVDETSLCLARSFLPFLKVNKQMYQFYFELDEENMHIPELLKLGNCMVFSKNGLPENEEWINELPVFGTGGWEDAHFVLTGNARSAQTFRKAVKAKTNGRVYLHGYWLEGKKGL